MSGPGVLLRGRPAVPAAPAGVRRPLVGVVGGMGPLASTELLRSVYLDRTWAGDRAAPRVLLWSDPDVADRTGAIESGRLGPLRDAVTRSVRGLAAAGADMVVVACVTAHLVVGEVAAATGVPMVSLIDVVVDELAAADRPHLLLCTRGTARAGIFHRHPRWAEVADRVVTPAPADQDGMHSELYRLKRIGANPESTAHVRRLLHRYGTSAFIAGCTELHLVAGDLRRSGAPAPHVIDPLWTVAERIARGTLEAVA